MKFSQSKNSILQDVEAFCQPSQPATADLTPMLDTIFLIILLLLATLMNTSIVRGFPVSLPAIAEETPIHKQPDRIEISLDSDGRIYLNAKALEPGDLDEALRSVNAEQASANSVLLRADRAVPYGRVAQILCQVANRLPNKKVVLAVQRIELASESNHQ